MMLMQRMAYVKLFPNRDSTAFVAIGSYFFSDQGLSSREVLTSCFRSCWHDVLWWNCRNVTITD